MVKSSMAARRKRTFQQRFKVTENRRAWVQVASGTFSLMRYDKPPDDKEYQEALANLEEGQQPPERVVESGPTVRILISRFRASKPITLDLTMLTEAELDAMKTIFDMAFEQAKPVVQLRDQEAQHAYEQGDDSYGRIYRPVPKLIIREGESGQHTEGVCDGSEDVPSREGSRSDIS